MSIINKLNKELSDIDGESIEVKEKLQKAWNDIFDDSSQIKKALISLENSSEYQFNECGDIENWYCPNFSNFPDESLEYLKEYFNDYHSIHYDEPKKGQNDCLAQICDMNGEYYLIDQSEHKLLHNNKIMLDLTDSTTKEELFITINDNMNKEGYFPGVYVSDKYGNVNSCKEFYKWLKEEGK